MASAKRFTAERIVAKVREAEKLQGHGATIPGLCKKLGVSEQTFYRWRTRYGALKGDEAPRLKALEHRRMPGEAGCGHRRTSRDANGARTSTVQSS
jgi:transposase-like protein